VRLIERNTRNRCGGIGTDSRQRAQIFIAGGRTGGGHLSCAPMEIARAAVIAQSAPGRQHSGFRRARERMHIGKAGEKAFEVGNDRFDARLLQHDFRKPDAVEIGRSAAPGQIALHAIVPGEERTPE